MSTGAASVATGLPRTSEAADMTAHRSLPALRARSWQDLAAEQDGVLTRQQALHGGLSEDQWQWRLDSQRWRPLLPGIVITHTGTATPHQRSWAAVLVGGDRACLSGDAALERLGFRLGALSALHVAVPDGRSLQRRVITGGGGPPVRVLPREVVRLDRLRHPTRTPPTVRVAPGVLHAAAWAASDRAAEWRVAAAVQQRLVLPSELRRALADMPSLHRRRLISTVLDDVEQGAHAASELDFLRFLRRHALPAPDRLQRPVRASGLRYLDAWWERQRVAAELDGAHHRSVEAWEDDVLRANDVIVAGRHDGTVLLRFTTGNLRHDAVRVAAQLAAALR